MHKSVVIGAGIAGLASGIRLAAKGHSVDIYEANSTPGGKMRQQFAQGFRFDMGPSIVTLPHLIDELFVLHNKNPRDYFDYSLLNRPFKYYYEDGTVISAYADIERFAEEIENKTKDSKKSFYKYLKNIRRKYSITRPVFIERSIHRVKDILHHNVFLGILRFSKIEAFKSMDKANRNHFKDPKLVTLFNNYATYVGSNPFVAPATLNVIQHLEMSLGMYLPNRGIYSIVEALYQLAKDVGVQFHFNTKVEKIITEEKKAIGIIANGQALSYDIVVSNMDVYLTYRHLLPDTNPPRHVIQQAKSSSVIAFYWGINRVFEDLNVHNLLFTENQKEEFRSIYSDQKISSDPSLYLYISSKHVPTDAPRGKENWFVLITAPNNQGQDWNYIVSQARKDAIAKLNRVLKTDITSHIEYEDHIDPKSIETDLLSAFGSVYGNSSNSMFAAFLRHANFSRKIKNLYFVGGSAHPGAGIPMCLNSAKIMEQVLKQS
ncbi:phytoene desaturase family protein [Reichenbachiella agarivorans]|uniref:Phytoene desaturase family protein n=1 Tax=Reichenbachiella agarivorans TaxID=2979464 RepID=A0ABY6CRA8_9BACT|nr:1-hydroxycarotenoid 3,4-desaturase CrtD [Reichenbachiella agarivorans]UXP33056.1 phytoene desaturase family protein [Reichenbachiella agarivorans]